MTRRDRAIVIAVVIASVLLLAYSCIPNQTLAPVVVAPAPSTGTP